MIHFFSKLHKKWVTILIVFALGLLAISLYVAHFEFRQRVFDIYFLNLERGRSILIITPNKKVVLIDGGQNSQIVKEITKTLPFYRRKIDIVILTNSSAKNVGGLVDVVNRYKVMKIIEPEMMATSTALYSLEKVIKKKGFIVEKVSKGDVFDIDNAVFSVLFPDKYFKYNKTSLPEIVLNISFNSYNILLLGDVSKTIQKSFIPKLNKIDIIEYAHSASDSRVSHDLFERLDPKYAIIKKQIRALPDRVIKTLPKKPPFDIEKQKNTEVVNIETMGSAEFSINGNKILRK